MLKATGAYKVKSMHNYRNVYAMLIAANVLQVNGQYSEIDHDAIANWSHIWKDFAIEFQSSYRTQLGFSLTQLELQVNEILEAFQTFATEKSPPR